MKEVILKIAKEFFQLLRNPVFLQFLLIYFPPQDCTQTERIMVSVLFLIEKSVIFCGFYKIIAVLV